MERSCPVCNSREYAPFADERIDHAKLDDFAYASRKQPEFMCLRLVRCLSCDLVYAPEPTAVEKLHESYSHAAFDSSQEAIAAARSYAKALKPYIGRIPHRHAAVDVGAGSGPLLPLLSDEGFSPVIGIEPSRAAIDAAPEE
ncbi:MAG: class I SAM-dependent methyltransferase, partial [Alphaproteobacteria bacterium]|nr:class I SAM-dependent methyltransferase [Alphaproteobacteria bacterium]